VIFVNCVLDSGSLRASKLKFMNNFVNCLLTGIMSLQAIGFMLHNMLVLLDLVAFYVEYFMFFAYLAAPIVSCELMSRRVMVRK